MYKLTIKYYISKDFDNTKEIITENFEFKYYSELIHKISNFLTYYLSKLRNITFNITKKE